MPEIMPPADSMPWMLSAGPLDTGWIDYATASWLMSGCELMASILPLGALIALLALAIQAVARRAPSTPSYDPFHCPLGQIHR